MQWQICLQSVGANKFDVLYLQKQQFCFMFSHLCLKLKVSDRQAVQINWVRSLGRVWAKEGEEKDFSTVKCCERRFHHPVSMWGCLMCALYLNYTQFIDELWLSLRQDWYIKPVLPLMTNSGQSHWLWISHSSCILLKVSTKCKYTSMHESGTVTLYSQL